MVCLKGKIKSRRPQRFIEVSPTEDDNMSAATPTATAAPAAKFEICKLERQKAICKWLHKEIDAADGTVYFYTRDDNLHPDDVTEEYTGTRIYLCKECNKTYYDKKYLKIHMSKFDKEKNECTRDDLWSYN